MFKRISIKNIYLMIFGLGLLFLAGGCQQQGTDFGTKGRPSVEGFQSLRVGLIEEVTSLDPIASQSYAEMQVARALYEGLFTLEPDTGRLVPWLVEHWELSSDGKTYTFRLRKGIKFHSGRELTAEDVKFSWQRVLSYGRPQDLANTLGLIIGANDYMAGKAEEAKGITITDPYTLQVILERPYQHFLLALAHPGAAIVDHQVLQLVGEHYGKPGNNQSPFVVLVGTGPFSIVEWIGGHQITFQPFEHYHSEHPKIRRLEFIQYPDLENLYTDFQAEYLDIVSTPSLHDRIEIPANQVIRLAGSGFYYLELNTLMKPFDNLAIRQAISRSLDRQALAAEFQGTALEGLLPRVLLEERFPRSRYQYQPEQVEGLLVHEGLQSLQEQPVILSFPEGERWLLIANQIQKQLEEVGFLLQLQSLPIGEFRRTTQKSEASLCLDYWQSPLPFSQFFFESRFASWGFANRRYISDPIIDERLAFIGDGADTDWERLENLLEVEQRVQDSATIISLWTTERYLVFQDDVGQLPLLPLGFIAWEKCCHPYVTPDID